MPKVSRLEVIQTGSRRRWTLEEKRRIVAESDSGTRQVSATARRYGLSTGQLFTWRRLARKGRLGGDAEPVAFAEAVIVDRGAAAAALPKSRWRVRTHGDRACRWAACHRRARR